MILVSEVFAKDFKSIQEIANIAWTDTYKTILSKAQIEYMLELFYSDGALLKNLNDGHHFLLATENSKPLGFAAYEPHYHSKNQIRLHKLYLLPKAQGKGVGKLLIQEVERKAKENNDETISLNVNRFNKAYLFYLKNGFQIIAEEDLAIGQGYLMEDYKMEKQL
ncbi:MAG: GNAT family N-acetyltransferase [Flavobacterium sp.]|jgi:GNAT superfamily N-acetyltransferase|nr:GNAT family N-acetyltransferase [Flavobacterium sp.]